VPPVASLLAQPQSAFAPVIQRWSADRAALGRRYSVEYSPERLDRFARFTAAWSREVAAATPRTLDRAAQVDRLMLAAKLAHEEALLARERRLAGEMRAVLPFADTLFVLLEERRRLERPDPVVAARRVAWMADTLERAMRSLAPGAASRIVAYRAADATGDLRRQFEAWRRFHVGYDPLLTWRLAEPAKRLDTALEQWRTALREKVVGWKTGQDEPIVGDPIGAEGLAADLALEMIPYTPAELIAIAEREFAWLEGEARRAARDMGLGDDWKAALERTKRDYPPVGEQTAAVRDMAHEAVEWVESRGLVTVPPLAKEIWRMEMMSAEAQKTNPFFLGGEVIQVASPTDGQTEAEKQMALRANNRHFSRATVQHELIPGITCRGSRPRAATRTGALLHAILRRGVGALVGDPSLEPRLPAHPRGANGDALLADASRRADHLLAQVPSRRVDAAAVHRLPRGPCRPRARERHRRGAPLVQRQLLAAVPGRVPAWRHAAAGAAPRAGDQRLDERAEFPRCGPRDGTAPIAMVRALLVPSVPLQMGQRASWRFAD
jgi:hypothetical protein